MILLSLILMFAGACGSDAMEELEAIVPDETHAITENIPVHHVSEYVATPFELTMGYAIERANARRNTYAYGEINKDMLWASIYGQEPWSVDIVSLAYGERVSSITKEEAIYDANTLFDVIRHVYGGYNYFGGDEVFQPLFDEILEIISEREQWNTAPFMQMLIDNLSTVIQDNHVQIGSSTLQAPYSTLGVNYDVYIWGVPFERSENGFRKQGTDIYIVDMLGHDMQEVFRLSMDEEGDLFYAPVIMRQSARYGTSHIIYHLDVVWSTGEEETVSLRRSRPYPAPGYGGETTLHYENGIPVVTHRTVFGHLFSPYAKGHEHAITFMSLVEYLHGEPVIIVDIRSNPGGHLLLSRMWLSKLLGEIVPNNAAILGVSWSEEMQFSESWHYLFPPIDERYEEVIARYHPFEYLGDFHGITSFPNTTIANDIKIILLVDRQTASAGDFFADQMLNLENTLVIGQNTAGVLLTSSFVPLYLPYSGIDFIFGPSRFAFHGYDWREGVGIAPDIWVTGDALTATLAMLENR